MTTEQKLEKTLDIIDRFVDHFGRYPDNATARDHFAVTGEHMILGDYGWEHGSALASYREEDPEYEPEDEVNAPA